MRCTIKFADGQDSQEAIKMSPRLLGEIFSYEEMGVYYYFLGGAENESEITFDNIANRGKITIGRLREICLLMLAIQCITFEDVTDDSCVLLVSPIGASDFGRVRELLASYKKEQAVKIAHQRNIKAKDIVSVFFNYADLLDTPANRQKQTKVALDLLDQYDGDLIVYCIVNYKRYIGSITGLGIIPYIVDKARKDFERDRDTKKMLQNLPARPIIEDPTDIQVVDLPWLNEKEEKHYKEVSIQDMEQMYRDFYSSNEWEEVRHDIGI